MRCPKMSVDPFELNRRHFLRATAAAACGLASRCNANAIKYSPVTDTHVYLGAWPLRRLATNGPSELLTLLRRAKIPQAWTGSFDGLFYKDIQGANLRLAEACRDAGDGMLVPIGSINPTLPDWEEDVRRCDEVFKMPGIRLHPTYHGYKLDDPRFARLLELVAARNLFVQLVVQLTDERHHLLAPRDPQVDLTPLAQLAQPIRGLRLLVSNGARAARNVTSTSLATLPNTYFDFARISNGEELRSLVDMVSVDRVVIGSAVPMHGLDETLKKLSQANLTAEQTRAIRGGNAQRLTNATEPSRPKEKPGSD